MRSRAGFALVLVLAMILALAFLATGMLAVGSRELLIARQLERTVELTTDAENAARRQLAAWSTAAAATLPVGGARDVTPAPAARPPGSGTADAEPVPRSVAVRVERIDTALYLLRTRTSRGGPGRPRESASAGMLVATLQPSTIAAAFPAAALVGTAVLDDGAISGAAGCVGDSSSHPGLWSEGIATVSGMAALDGTPPSIVAPRPPLPTPDPFAAPLLTAIADVELHAGSVSPGPAVFAGECLRRASNWGDPDPAGACHGLRPLVRARGPLTVTGGRGAGILVVEGDLTLRGSFRFDGLVLVSGRLLVSDDAYLRGSVRAAELHLTGGRILHDGCAIRASTSAPALDRPFRAAAGLWVPVW